MGAAPGQDFSSLLDELLARAEADVPVAAPARRADFLGVVNSFGKSDINSRDAAFEYLQSAERDMVETEAVAALDQIVVTTPPSIEPADIALELGLSGAKATESRDLDRARRDFAFANHPDRVEAGLRDRAMVRMQIANRLIDEAKRRARS